jgi:hypothetical protein
MATRRRPLANVDPNQLSVSNGIDTSSAASQALGELAQIRAAQTNVVGPYVGSIIPNLLTDIQQLLAAPPSQAVTGTFFLATQPVSGSVAVNNLAVLQDLVRDKKVTEGTDIITSASATPIVTGAKQLRSLMFVNYQAAKLYVQVFGVGTNPAVGAVPDLPPFPVNQDQILFLDQQTLGVDWLGFPGYTVRVSSSPYSYAPVVGAGIWQMTVRGKI